MSSQWIQLDCDAHKVVCGEPRWDAFTLPTLKAYRDGQIFTYFERPVTAKGIVDFMKGLAGIGDDYNPDEDADDAEAEEEDTIENEVRLFGLLVARVVGGGGTIFW